MAIKAILPFGDPVLRKKAKPIESITPKILKLLDDLAETLYDSNDGAGLAAPQIGILRRLIVMDCGDGLIELINPEIVYQSGEQVGSEGCLSLPGYYGIVKRSQHVKVKTLTRSGEELVIEAEGFLARCIQHEVDHLNGRLYIDLIQENSFFVEGTNERADLIEACKLSYTNL
ncbi:peptide deformylase [Paenibacillus sp. NRS-1760]|uniref:peptide deformylase n=1 Tax=Paenibacillus sp. NRS-1760 TaxID=3233902 RepID=UPI003D2D1B8A